MAGQTDTISRGQLEALKAGIRATAEANPAGTADKGRRCAEIAGAVCSGFGVDGLAELFQTEFPAAMKRVAEMAVPKRRQGQAEARLRDARARLDAVRADISNARRGVAAFRHERAVSPQPPPTRRVRFPVKEQFAKPTPFGAFRHQTSNAWLQSVIVQSRQWTSRQPFFGYPCIVKQTS